MIEWLQLLEVPLVVVVAAEIIACGLVAQIVWRGYLVGVEASLIP
jgi:hypothetical protein